MSDIFVRGTQQYFSGTPDKNSGHKKMADKMADRKADKMADRKADKMADRKADMASLEVGKLKKAKSKNPPGGVQKRPKYKATKSSTTKNAPRKAFHNPVPSDKLEESPHFQKLSDKNKQFLRNYVNKHAWDISLKRDGEHIHDEKSKASISLKPGKYEYMMHAQYSGNGQAVMSMCTFSTPTDDFSKIVAMAGKSFNFAPPTNQTVTIFEDSIHSVMNC